MPRKSPYTIELTIEEERELSRRASKYTLPYFQVVRAKMILLAAQGWENEEIVEHLNTPREVVSRWLKRFFEARLAGLDEQPRSGRPRAFPRKVVVEVKAMACELPATSGLPLSRFSVAELARQARQSGLVAGISDTTVWRRLHEDAIRPWRYRSWIFPRDPQFAVKAGRILDLYHQRIWEGRPLQEDEFVISADEKTSIQARARRHRALPPQSGSVAKLEHEYTRCGAWAYLAALDVHRMKLFGRCEKKTGILAFDRLVAQVMAQPPFHQARRVFWIVENGSSHRAQASVQRLQEKYPHLVLVHGPVHASRLNQIEIYFSIVQRKVLTPNDFPSLRSLEERLLNFQDYYESIAQPFHWNFTRQDLAKLLHKIETEHIKAA